ncbi:MAG: M23 family metallopeptidase [Bacillota bacterium]|nr:M23 family metallopeptidase [Bacillota bacterium]
MRQQKKQKDRTAITLVMCFCLMALVSVFVVKANIDKVKDNVERTRTADVVKEKSVNETEAADDNIVDSRSSENHEASPAAQFILPIEGDIIKDYSMDMPIYWPTLDQYMTHGGIDIASPVGTEVKACAGGTVTKIEEDDRFGITVEINHGDGIISMYGNLAKDGLVELGEIVSQGTVIGKVGQSSLFEFDDAEHLHFEMRLNGEPADPGNYIKGL